MAAHTSHLLRLHFFIRSALTKLRNFDGIATLALRLYLAPIFWMAGISKLQAFDSTVEWFGNSDWGLGLPLPWLMAFLATAAELVGAVLLTLGLATRLISVPLIITMIIAITTVHGENGWQAIADPKAPFATESVLESPDKLAKARSILQEHGNYEWLTSSGKFVILNNGIEFAATYLTMLLALLFLGGGRFVSADFWLMRWLNNKVSRENSATAY